MCVCCGADSPPTGSELVLWVPGQVFYLCVCVCVFKSVWCVMESSISFFFRRQFATHFPRSGIPFKSLQSLQSESGTSVADVPKSTSAGEAPLAKQAISRVDSDLEWFIAFCNIWE